MSRVRQMLLLVLAFVVGGSPARAADAAPVPLVMNEVAPGVFVHRGVHEEMTPENRGDVANIGFIVGRRCVAVIDTGGSPAVGQALKAAVRHRTQRPICYVINTHVHPDHQLGNAAFSDKGTVFVGHTRLPDALAARGETYLRTAEREVGAASRGQTVRGPDERVEARRELDLGGRKLRLEAWPTAHTDNDLTVYDESTDTWWLSDLLFVERTPVVDGRLLGWLAWSREARERMPRHIVPGHGPVDPPWPGALDAQTRYLEGLAKTVRAALKADRTLTEVLEAAPTTDPAGWRLFEHYHRRNLSAAYSELEWE